MQTCRRWLYLTYRKIYRKIRLPEKNINMDEKENGVDIVARHNWEKDMVDGKTTYTFSKDDLLHVHTDIFDKNNWNKKN